MTEQGGATRTLTSVSFDAAGARPRQVPALTILAHPRSSRVGAVARLFGVASGRTAELQRLEPLFVQPGSVEGTPLAAPWVSRSPILLEPDAKGGLWLDPTRTKTEVRIGGIPLPGRHAVPEAALDRGVVLVVARRIALLLHRLPARPATTASALGLIGASPAIEEVRRGVAQVAPIDFPVLLDQDGDTINRWPVRGLPTTFVIDPDGRIVYQAIGGRAWDDPELLDRVRALARK